MSLEVYSRQSKAFQYDGYKINSEMREHINAEKSSSNVHKDRDTVNFSAEGRNSRTLKTVREAVHLQFR